MLVQCWYIIDIKLSWPCNRMFHYHNVLQCNHNIISMTISTFSQHLILNTLLKCCKSCRNPTLAKCGGEAQHLEKVRISSPPRLPNVQSSTARPKTPRIEVFLVSVERSWNVDIENALALAIQTSVAQVMGKRRAGSQTASLTPDH